MFRLCGPQSFPLTNLRLFRDRFRLAGEPTAMNKSACQSEELLLTQSSRDALPRGFPVAMRSSFPQPAHS